MAIATGYNQLKLCNYANGKNQNLHNPNLPQKQSINTQSTSLYLVI